MSKVLKVKDVILEMTAVKKVNKNGQEEYSYNRFSKKKFNQLLKALANDPEYKTQVAVIKQNGIESVQELSVYDEFRGFVHKLLVSAGMDKEDAKIALSENYTVDSVDGLYEFFATAMWLYMDAGNKFDLPTREDFKGSIYLKEVPEVIKTSKVFSPQTKESLGERTTKSKKHKEVKVKSSCPSWMKERLN